MKWMFSSPKKCSTLKIKYKDITKVRFYNETAILAQDDATLTKPSAQEELGQLMSVATTPFLPHTFPQCYKTVKRKCLKSILLANYLLFHPADNSQHHTHSHSVFRCLYAGKQHKEKCSDYNWVSVALIYQLSVETRTDSGVKAVLCRVHVKLVKCAWGILAIPVQDWVGGDQCGGWEQSTCKKHTCAIWQRSKTSLSWRLIQTPK